MKNIILVIVAILLTTNVSAFTSIAGGTINSDSTWTLAGSPYHIQDDLTIGNNGVLHIEAEVVIKFKYESPYKVGLIINGVLDVQGTAINPVVFTSERDDSWGGDSNGDGNTTTPAKGDWGYIKFSTASNFTNTFENALVKYAGYYYAGGNHYNYAFWIYGASTNVIVQNCSFTDSYDQTIRIDNAVTDIQNNSISNSTSWAIYANNTTGDLSSNVVDNCGNGLYYKASSTTGDLVNNTVSNCSGDAIYYEGNGNSTATISGNAISNSIDAIVTDNTGNINILNNQISNNNYPFSQYNYSFPVYTGNVLTGNTQNVIAIKGNINYVGYPVTETLVNVQGLNMPYLIIDDLTIGNNITLSIPESMVIKFKYESPYKVGLIINGVLDVQGTAINPVVFTSERDDSWGGDSNGDGNTTTPAKGDWGYIKFSTASNFTNTFENALVKYAGYYYAGGNHYNYAFWIYGASTNVIVQNCTFSDIYDIGIYSANLSSDSFLQIDDVIIKDCSGHGIYLQNSSSNNVFIKNVISQNNNYGLYLNNADATIDACGFSDNNIGLYVYGNTNPIIVNSYFLNNSNIGLWVVGSNSNPMPIINDNNFANNLNYNIKLETYNNPDTTVVNAQNNWYNTTDSATIVAKLYHNPNHSSSATLNWIPYAMEENVVPASIYCPADINMDTEVNGVDLALLGFSFGQDTSGLYYNTDADIDISGRVDGFDLAILGLNFGHVGNCISPAGSYFSRSLPEISIESNSKVVSVGDTLTVNFLLNSFDQPFAFITNITVNSSMLDFCNAYAGDMLSENGNCQTSIMQSGNDNYRMLGVTRMDVEQKLSISEGSLLKIKFIKKAENFVLRDALGLSKPLLLNGFGEWADVINIIYGDPTGIDVDFLENGVKIFPNPFDHQLTIEFSLKDKAHVKCYLTNLVGQVTYVIQEKDCSAGDFRCMADVSSIPKGMYLLVFESDNIHLTKKIIHQ